jgi:hypothetical protein
MSPITVTESVTPLSAARGRSVSVQVSGTVTDSDTAATLNSSLAYAVFNSRTNRQIGSGTAMIAGDGSYLFDVRLPGGRHSSSEDFSIVVVASDSDGNSGIDFATVAATPRRGGSGRGSFHVTSADQRVESSNTLNFGGAGQGQSNTITVNGNNNTVTLNVTNYESNTYNVTITTMAGQDINSPPKPPPPPHHHPPGPPPPPPHHPPGPPGPPPHPGPPGPPPHPGPPGPDPGHPH